MPSKRSSGRRPAAEQPEFLIDRSIGRLAVPEALRAVGLTVHTLAEIYGEDAAQETEDVKWIKLAAQRDWIVLCKDDRIRRRPAGRDALVEGCVRAFCLTNANLNFADQASYFAVNRHRILSFRKKLASSIVHSLNNAAFPVATEFISELDRIRDLLSTLALGLARDAASSPVFARDLVGAITRARNLAPDLARALGFASALGKGIPPSVIDASGADLSRGDFSDLSLLDDVIWTPETIWPTGIAEQVERLSDEIKPGVYRIRGGTERDSSLVIT